MASHCGQIVIFLSVSFFGFSIDILIFGIRRDVQDVMVALLGWMKLSELTHIIHGTYSKKTPVEIVRFAS